MENPKSTTLPHVLHEYDPEFNEQTYLKTKRIESRSTNNQLSPRGKQSDNQKSQSPDRRSSPDKGVNRSQGARKSPPPPPSREATSDFKKRQERQHNERMYSAWEQVKDDVRESELDRLKERISLQHELQRAQEQRHEQREEQRRQRQAKKREREKAEKDATIEALQQVCRESLDEDRRVAKETRADEYRQKLHEQNEKHAFPAGLLLDVPQRNDVPQRGLEVESPPGGDVEDSPGVDGGVESEDPRGSLASAPIPGVSLDGTTEDGGFETLVEEEEEEDLVAEDTEEVLPWHHLQLYQLYGKEEADSFLHPKIETEKKADITLNPRLKAIGGRAGAGTLWDVLRNESRMKLVRQDSKLLSQELKSAFGAFAREGLANQKKAVQRNFSSDDVPDMEKLMDQSRIHDAQDFRHKVELMFRSSTINQDRTKVLLYNNPPPDLNNQQGGEGVARYMPSWSDTWDEESEMSYKKWLQHPKESDEPLSLSYSPSYHGDASPQNRTATTDSRLRESTSVPQPQRDQRPANQKRYVFLTEEQARTPGQFTRRRRELEEAKHRPSAYGNHGDGKHVLPDIPLQKSVSAMASLGASGDYVMSRSPTLNSSGSKPRGQRARSEMSSQFISQWEPLSLNALLEYRNTQDALGHGKFSQGKTSVWRSDASVTAR